MKLLFLLLALPMFFGCDNGDEKRDDNGIVNIPDINFKGYLIRNSAININGDLEIQVIEASTFNDSIDCSSMNISNLKGIEAFTALTQLVCYSNKLTNLDLSKNTALTTLDCFGNQLKSLDVSKNTALTYLRCYENQLTSLDVSKNSALIYFKCNANQLTSLDVSQNTALATLDCGLNKITSLDVSKNTALTSLWCAENKLISLDVSKNTDLTDLRCYNNQLSSLDVSKHTLDWLYCDGNQFDCDALISKYGIENPDGQ